MSLENIINYTMKTPANTNPSVMSSVINNSFKETKEEILNEAMPKVIDLDEYNITPVLLNLFGNDGGTMNITDVGNFWDEVTIDRPMIISFAFPPVNRVNVSSVTTVCNNSGDHIAELCFECVIDNNDTVFRTAVMLAYHDDKTKVTVKVAVL